VDKPACPSAQHPAGEGRRIEIAQATSVAGRINHCMRIIGLRRRVMGGWSQSRAARSFSKSLAADRHMERIAQSRIRIEQARLPPSRLRT